MAKQTINLGTSELAGDGESIRSAFDKCNDNFTENYASIASIESDIATLDGSKIVYGDLSVTTASASGAGALSYNSSTGVFTFTPAASGFDGDYNSLTNKPTIPTVPTTVSSFTNDSGYLTSYTETDPVFTAWDKSTGISITESQISDLQSYLTSYTETNDLTSAVTWANVPDANITESSVTQHQAALTITESQISDLSHTSTGNFTFSNNGITTANAASNITIAINGATASDPPAFVSKQWSFDTDGSFNFHNPLDIPSLQASITATKVGQWDDAYGWGDHSTQGYLTSVALNDVSDVTITSASSGQVLKYNGSSWVNGTDSGGIALTDLSVTQNSASGTGALSYNNSTGVFSYTPPALFSGSFDDLTDVPATFGGSLNYVQTQPTRSTSVTIGQTIASVSITTTGGPVMICANGDVNGMSNGAYTVYNLYRDSTEIGTRQQAESSATNENAPYAISVVDAPSAGTYTYALKIVSVTGTVDFGEHTGPTLYAVELKGPEGAAGTTDYTELSNKPTNVSSFTNDAGYVESDTTGITGADQVSNIVTLTQAEYDAIGTPNASTVYIIVG